MFFEIQVYTDIHNNIEKFVLSPASHDISYSFSNYKNIAYCNRIAATSAKSRQIRKFDPFETDRGCIDTSCDSGTSTPETCNSNFGSLLGSYVLKSAWSMGRFKIGAPRSRVVCLRSCHVDKNGNEYVQIK